MRYRALLTSTILYSFFTPDLEAFQLQYRIYHSAATFTHSGGAAPTLWNEAYLQSPSQTIIEPIVSETSKLDSPGQEISIGTELLYPHLYADLGFSRAEYFPSPQRRIEDLTAKLGVQAIMNVQGRWMPYLRVGLSQHRLKSSSYGIEEKGLPTALRLSDLQDTFIVRREWSNNPKLLNADLSFGMKLYPVPTTAIVPEIRYSETVLGSKVKERISGINSLSVNSGFTSTAKLKNLRLTTQEFSLGIEVEL